MLDLFKEGDVFTVSGIDYGIHIPLYIIGPDVKQNILNRFSNKGHYLYLYDTKEIVNNGLYVKDYINTRIEKREWILIKDFKKYYDGIYICLAANNINDINA
jgi:hypothetical protein